MTHKVLLAATVLLFVLSVAALADAESYAWGAQYFENNLEMSVPACDSNYDEHCDPMASCGYSPNVCNLTLVDQGCGNACLAEYGNNEDGMDCFFGCVDAADNFCTNPGGYCTW